MLEVTKHIETTVELQTQDDIHKLVALMFTLPRARSDRFDVFTPGMYIRSLIMPANTAWISEKHATQHPFVIARGELSIWTEKNGLQFYKGFNFGVTEPGTQRVLEIFKETLFITFHATDIFPVDDSPEAHAEAVDKIENWLKQKTINPYMRLIKEEEKEVMQ